MRLLGTTNPKNYLYDIISFHVSEQILVSCNTFLTIIINNVLTTYGICIISWKVQMATWSRCIRTWFDDTTCHEHHLPPKMAVHYQFIMYFPYYLLLLKHNFFNLKGLDCKITVLSKKKKVMPV
jgi:hypothetical protein